MSIVQGKVVVLDFVSQDFILNEIRVSDLKRLLEFEGGMGVRSR